jgi:hypothetical protein
VNSSPTKKFRPDAITARIGFISHVTGALADRASASPEPGAHVAGRTTTAPPRFSPFPQGVSLQTSQGSMLQSLRLVQTFLDDNATKLSAVVVK